MTDVSQAVVIHDTVIKDAQASHWVYRLRQPARSCAQLSRLDRPIGYWLLTLPGWMGLALGSLSRGFAFSDLTWALLMFVGAVAMRGAGCTYNDIVDQDLDAKVERTALRPLPAGTVSRQRAWLWLLAQCFVGLCVWLCLPRLAQIISLCALPLVAAYPFMKRITWWPQVWLGLTFNWAVLVAYAIKTQALSPSVITLYLGLMFWTVGYDTIYACQDIEDDAIIGVKSTARKFGKRIKLGVAISYSLCAALTTYAVSQASALSLLWALLTVPFFAHLIWQVTSLNPQDSRNSLKRFKSNLWAGGLLIAGLLSAAVLPLTSL